MLIREFLRPGSRHASSLIVPRQCLLRPRTFKPFAQAAAVGRSASRGEGRRTPQRTPSQQRVSSAADEERPKRDKLQIWKNQLSRLASNPRAVAVAQLLRIEEEGAFVGLVGGSPGGEAAPDASQEDMLAGRNWREKLSDRDARLVTELVAGVTRWRRRLDYLICHLTRVADVSELDPPIRQALRMGLYELLELNAPGHVINEHVALIKRVMNQGAGGFCNGVLRNAVRLIEARHLPQPPSPPPSANHRQMADALGVAASHPTWLVERWLRQLGPPQTLALLKWNNSRPLHSLRVSPSLGTSPAQLCAKLLQGGVTAQPSTYLPREFLKVESGLQALLATGMLLQGQVQVQDEAAGMVVALLDPQPGETLMDVCAAPGGKTLFAAARMGGKGRILALDVSDSRLQALAGAAARQGYGGMVATHAADFRSLAGGPAAAAAAPRPAVSSSVGGVPVRRLGGGGRGAGGGGAAAPSSTAAPAAPALAANAAAAAASPAAAQLLRSQFDRVLLDAPCSGTGVLAKRADLRWRRQPGDLQQLAGLQDALLEAAAGWVRPGGVLVYSTCSIEREENQERVVAFLQRHPDFAVEPPPPSAGVAPECLTPEGFLQMLPYVHATDGAFAARLRRSL